MRHAGHVVFWRALRMFLGHVTSGLYVVVPEEEEEEGC
jgi:hypothetical protein